MNKNIMHMNCKIFGDIYLSHDKPFHKKDKCYSSAQIYKIANVYRELFIPFFVKCSNDHKPWLTMNEYILHLEKFKRFNDLHEITQLTPESDSFINPVDIEYATQLFQDKIHILYNVIMNHDPIIMQSSADNIISVSLKDPLIFSASAVAFTVILIFASLDSPPDPNVSVIEATIPSKDIFVKWCKKEEQLEEPDQYIISECLKHMKTPEFSQTKVTSQIDATKSAMDFLNEFTSKFVSPYFNDYTCYSLIAITLACTIYMKKDWNLYQFLNRPIFSSTNNHVLSYIRNFGLWEMTTTQQPIIPNINAEEEQTVSTNDETDNEEQHEEVIGRVSANTRSAKFKKREQNEKKKNDIKQNNKKTK